jgi:hypothetical protein
MGMSGNGKSATWGRQTEASIQWGNNQFRFLEVPEKTPILNFFLKKIAAPEICRLWRPPSPPNGETASANISCCPAIFT